MGVFLSADLITTFLFFEIMSFTSYVLVIHDEQPQTIEASKTYMAVAVIGGLSMLFGILLVKHLLGTTEISALFEAVRDFEGGKAPLYAAAVFMLAGFGGKAGMYPIHIWLPTAHPAAPAPASALLSGILTKTGVFGIILISAQAFHRDFRWGMLMLIIGMLGMLTGAVLALFSTDIKRILAYSSVSQIGFIMLGIGMQGIVDEKYAPLAIQGTMLHMVNHSLIKLVLFMMAGVVYVNLHELDLNKIRGFGRGKPLFTLSFLMGAFAIIGIPLWSGYISKKLLQKAITYHMEGVVINSLMFDFFRSVEGVFILTGGLTTAYMIKIFVCVCLERNRFNHSKMTESGGKYMNGASAVVLALSSMLLLALGVSPNLFMIPIAKFGQGFMLGTDYYSTVSFYDIPTLMDVLPPLGIGLVVYVFIVRGCLMSRDGNGRSIYINRWPAWLDLEKKLYRPVVLTILPFIGAMVARIYGGIVSGIVTFMQNALTAMKVFYAKELNIKSRSLGVIDNTKSYFDEMSSAIGASVVPKYVSIAFIFTSIGRKAFSASKEFLHIDDNVNDLKQNASGAVGGRSPTAAFSKDESGLWNVRVLQKFMAYRYLFSSLAYSILICFIGIIFVLAFVLLR